MGPDRHPRLGDVENKTKKKGGRSHKKKKNGLLQGKKNWERERYKKESPKGEKKHLS